MALICDSLEEKGGVEKLVSLQANYFLAKGYMVYIFTRYVQNKPPAYPLSEGISVVSFNWHMQSSGHRKIFKFFSFMRWIRRELKSFNPDWILTNGLNVGVLTIFANPELRQKTIACDHNHFGNANGLWANLRRIAYRGIRTVVSLTLEDLPLYQAVNSHSVCIYNPVSLSVSDQTFSGNRQALAVGRHTRQKGFDLLLEAWAEVTKTHPEWKLTIVGEGEETGNLQRQIKDLGLANTVQLDPFSDDIVHYYRNSNLFIISSRFEGLSLVMIEAIAMGLPVVAFGCKTGPREVLEQGGGLLVDDGDVPMLARTIVYFIEHPEIWEALSDAGKKNAQRFTHENYFREWEALLR